MLRIIKQCLFTGLAFSASVNSLNCVLMNNQECKTRPQIVNTNGDDPVFFLFSIKQTNAAVVATTSRIHMQNCVFLVLIELIIFKTI